MGVAVLPVTPPILTIFLGGGERRRRRRRRRVFNLRLIAAFLTPRFLGGLVFCSSSDYFPSFLHNPFSFFDYYFFFFTLKSIKGEIILSLEEYLIKKYLLKMWGKTNDGFLFFFQANSTSPQPHPPMSNSSLQNPTNSYPINPSTRERGERERGEI